jgi:hypothetical protein
MERDATGSVSNNVKAKSLERHVTPTRLAALLAEFPANSTKWQASGDTIAKTSS